MKKNSLKSIFLTFLIISSIYQIIMLWFDNSSDRNFFYNFIEVVGEQANTQNYEISRLNLLKPRTIGVYLGTAAQDFNTIKSTSTDFSSTYEQGIQVITTVLSKGTISEKLDADDDEIWSERGILLIYDVPWEKDVLTLALGLDKAKLNGIDQITSIGIIPAKNNSNHIKVSVFSENKKVYIYKLNKALLEKENNSFNRKLDTMESNDNPAFISTIKDEIKLFETNILIPLRSNLTSYYKNISFTKPFIAGDQIDKEALEIYISGFFSNPDIIWITENSDVLIYGDNKVMVKYSDDAILEYTSIDQGKTIQSDIATAYSIAEQFLKHDMKISEQKYYLVDYDYDGNDITFNFGYTYNDYPLYMNKEILKQNNMISPMKITVSNAKVTKYKRILLEAMVDQGDTTTLKSMFYDVLDVFLANKSYEEGDIQDMFLGYVYAEDRKAELMWVLETNDDFYTLSLE